MLKYRQDRLPILRLERRIAEPRGGQPGAGKLSEPAPALRKLIWNLQHLATHCAEGLGL